MTSLLLAAPVLLSLTLLVSGLAKLGARRGTEEAMTSLRLPLRALHRPLASVLPVTEILLALALWVPSVPVQVVVAVAVALLMLAYLVIIARALSWDEQVECSCFGSLASPTVSRTTLGRNLVLTALGLLTVAAAASGAMTQALMQTPLALAGLGAAVLLGVVLTALTLGGTAPAGAAEPAAPTAPAGAPEDDQELLDYERAPIPAAVLQRPDGRVITLDQLTAQQAALLVFVTEGCGPCERVLDQVPGWIAELSPVMQVEAVFSRPLDQLRERTEQRVGEHALHDLQFITRTALGATGAPSAVLLGADGLLAGGPVRGGSGVIEFVEEIQAQLRLAQQEGELPVQQG